MLRRSLVLLLAVLAAVGATGCGGQAEEVREANAYAERVNAIQAAFERDLATLNRTVSAARERQDVADAAARLQRRIDGVRKELEAVQAPAAVAGAHRSLIAAFQQWAVPLREFRRSLRRRDIQAALRAKVRFDSESGAVVERVNDARRRINEALRELSD